MKIFASALAAALTTLLASGVASATVIDFAGEARGAERGVADRSVLNTSALGGLNLQFSAGPGGSNQNYAYFNDLGNNHEPGLGVCTLLGTGGQCASARDDSIAGGEWVRIAFNDAPFDVKRLSFNSETGRLVSSLGQLRISTAVGGVVSTALMTFAQARAFDFGLVDWIEFGHQDIEFYVATISDVPIPGSLALLLSGIGGLAFATSRRRARS